MTTDIEDRAAALAERYARLRHAAQAVVDDATAVGTPERPMAGIPAHVLRTLRRELDGEPQPQPLDFMSVA
jgi:hypothetical protein